MDAFTRIFTATEDYFVTIPLRQITRNIQRVRVCSGNSASYIFGKLYLLISYLNFFIDRETKNALKRISDAIDTWAEYIRVDPSDLVLDEPYNSLIFQPSVSHSYINRK